MKAPARFPLRHFHTVAPMRSIPATGQSRANHASGRAAVSQSSWRFSVGCRQVTPPCASGHAQSSSRHFVVFTATTPTHTSEPVTTLPAKAGDLLRGKAGNCFCPRPRPANVPVSQCLFMSITDSLLLATCWANVMAASRAPQPLLERDRSDHVANLAPGFSAAATIVYVSLAFAGHGRPGRGSLHSPRPYCLCFSLLQYRPRAASAFRSARSSASKLAFSDTFRTANGR